MNQFELQLLQVAYENYIKTGNACGNVLPRNGNELMYLTDAAEWLSESEYIIPLSDNIGSTTITNLNICYELTELGLQYAINHFKKS